VIPPDRAVDPGGRDGCRAPIPWDGTADHGWPTPSGRGPWLPFPPESDIRNYAAQRADPSSVLHLYRRLIDLRRRQKALGLGRFELVEVPDGVLGFVRTLGDERWVVLVNFTDQAVSIDRGDGPGPGQDEARARSLYDGAVVALSSDGVGEQRAFDGRLGADQALVLRR
jgi:alpha-glucosidase